MEAFLEFFETMPTWQKLAWIFACLSINWIAEAGAPLKHLRYKKWRHAATNLVFLSCSVLVSFLFGLATLWVFDWVAANDIGLLYMIDLPVIVELIIAVAILDFFAQYFLHYLLHKVKWMWKFHMIHHSDTEVDATTGTRHHPGDYLLREVFALVSVVFLGIPLAFFLFYKILTVFFAYFTHANITIPAKLDQALSWVIITPNMHKFHHHFERPWTDTNFGNIFSIWDRIFGTLVYDDPHKVKYGLDVLDDSRSADLGYQFKVPFDQSIETDY